MFILLISTRFSSFPLIHNKSSIYRNTFIIYFDTFQNDRYLKYISSRTMHYDYISKRTVISSNLPVNIYFNNDRFCTETQFQTEIFSLMTLNEQI